ncbi:LysR family transcriptional regulator [uncultured Roseobacter sp.]|uniref:LysR family transcriptional regulator n=1 Tax=uncultured Roseobacter sp. TaxID=114847 RepID=UPI00261F0778|nr:LysR family transcriptional regulator [uncultured Roseobacter sp.]
MTISFDLNTLKTFLLVAQHLNFTIVAGKRHTVQSAVSAQIRKLEASLGQPLVSRGRGQTMHLTAEGEAFLVYARRIVALSEEAVETVRTTKSRQILRLGTTVTLALSVVSEVLRDFAVRQPGVQIQIQCDRSDRLLERLEEGEIDVAYMMDQGRHSLRRFVHSTKLDWVCARDFVLPKDGPIPLAFLTDGRDLRQYALKALDNAGLQGHVTHLSPHPIGVRALVQAGLALTVMPRQTIVGPLSTAPDTLDLPPLSPVALAAYHAPRDGLSSANLLLSQLEAMSR